MWRNFLRVLASVICAVLCLVSWFVAVSADGGAGTGLPDDAFAGACDDWTLVNDSAFGVPSSAHTDPGGEYYAEDPFEVVVFKGQLYLGMEADDAYGAQIWRSKAEFSTVMTQEDWEEVAQVNSLPFGNGTTADEGNGILKLQNDHIDSLAGFNDVLYASTANGGNTQQGFLIYSSTTGNPDSWLPVIEAGFGLTENVNFKDMQVFNDWLCGGTRNTNTGAQVWCTQNGVTWLQKNYGGFGVLADDPDTVEVWSGHTYAGALYFGTQRVGSSPNTFQGVLYRTNDISSAVPLWTPVYTSPTNGYRIDILGDIDNNLYISYHDPVNGIVIIRSASGDVGTWVPVNIAGMDNDSNNIGTIVDGATVYNGMLYCAITNITSGTQVWRTDGVNRDGGLQWKQVGPAGFGQSGNRTAELIAWNGYLYAWSGNYISGQEVRRTSCAVCQSRNIEGPGQYDYAAVGMTLTFTVEALDVVTVCVKPGLMPVYPRGGIVLSRTVDVSSSPPEGSFTADISFTYEPQELDSSAVHSPTLYLRYWDEDAWATTCEGDHNIAKRTITCRNLTRFFSWAVSNTPGMPLNVRISKLNAETTIIGFGTMAFIFVGIYVGLHRKRRT